MAVSSEDVLSSPTLPFLSKTTFDIAVNHFIEHLDAHSSLKYEIKRSPVRPMKPTYSRYVYLEIIKFVSLTPSETDAAGDTNISHKVDEIQMDLEKAEEDPESLPPPVTSTHSSTHKITYHILLSPIYSVPVVYFNISPLYSSSDINVLSLEDIYDVLVPVSHRSAVSSIGIQGGISQTHHPYLGTTSWFVHPCRTAEALQMWMGDGKLGLVNYMGVWVGIVGAVVGLVI
ncbi:hypothetical protein AA313_de0201599 [Arthrobotrys entomopaga]|nr:hypothetical protein AA313_de0201599 [Arthrobotrys entomopaga]